MKVSILDYSVGNILSVRRAFEAVGADVQQITDPADVHKSDRLVVPGVGAFGSCMQALNDHRMLDPLKEYIRTERPMLGICVGMQMLLESSSEFGEQAGLGVFPGRVDRIPAAGVDNRKHKVPLIGWTPLLPANNDPDRWKNTILSDLEPGEHAYFVHSYAAYPTNPEDILASTEYGGHPIAAVIGGNHIYGCQFHPEKSGPTGLKVLSGFMSI